MRLETDWIQGDEVQDEALRVVDELVAGGAYGRALLHARSGFEEGYRCLGSRLLYLACLLSGAGRLPAQIAHSVEPYCSPDLLRAARATESADSDDNNQVEWAARLAETGALPTVYARVPENGATLIGDASVRETLWSFLHQVPSNLGESTPIGGQIELICRQPAILTCERLALLDDAVRLTVVADGGNGAAPPETARQVATLAELCTDADECDGAAILIEEPLALSSELLACLRYALSRTPVLPFVRESGADDDVRWGEFFIEADRQTRVSAVAFVSADACRSALRRHGCQWRSCLDASFAEASQSISIGGSASSAARSDNEQNLSSSLCVVLDLRSDADVPPHGPLDGPHIEPPVFPAVEPGRRDARRVQPANDDLALFSLPLLSAGTIPPPAQADRPDVHSLEASADITGAALLRLLDEFVETRGVVDCAVVMMTDDFQYSPRYAQSVFVKQQRTAEGVAVSLRGLELGRGSNAVAFTADDPPRLFTAILLALSCAPLTDARVALQGVGALRAADAIVYPDAPAIEWSGAALVGGDGRTLLDRIASNREHLQRLFLLRERTIPARLRDSMDGPISAVPAYIAFLREHGAMQKLLGDAVSSRFSREASLTTLSEELSSHKVVAFLDQGEDELVRSFLLEGSSHAHFIASLRGEAFDRFLQLAQMSGVQEEVGQAIAPYAWRLTIEDYGRVVTLFAFLAGALDEDEYVSCLALSFVHTIHIGKPRRGVLRHLEVATRYCSVKSLVNFLQVLDDLKPEVLSSDAYARRLIGNRLVRAPLARFSLQRSKLQEEDFRVAADAPSRLEGAINSSDRATAISALWEISEESRHIRLLPDRLRAYTHETANLQITSRDWCYPVLQNVEETVRLAVLLSDAEEVSRHLGQLTDAELIAAANSMLGDQAALEELYAAWSSDLGVHPVRFGHGSLTALFDGIAASPAPARTATVADAPLISVIITAHNCDPELLERSIDSVLRQTYHNFEILLVDDASNPELRDRVFSLSEKDWRIRFLETGRNSGPYVSRNLALAHGSGRFVAIQDGDDYAHPQRFSVQIGRFLEDPQLIACASTHLRFDQNGAVQFEHRNELRGDGTMSTMFRTAAFSEIGRFAAVRSRGDVEVRERIKAIYGPASYLQIPCPLVFCSSAPQSLSHTVVREKRPFLQDFRRAFELLRRSNDGARQAQDRLAVSFGLRP